MKRRIYTAVLCVLAALVLGSGCSADSAYSLTRRAIAKAEALDAADITVEASITMSGEGLSYDVPLTYHMKANGLQGDSPTLLLDIPFDIHGVSTRIQPYIEDDWVYVAVEDVESWKQHIDDFGTLPTWQDIRGIVKTLPREQLADVQPTQNEDGSRTVSVTLTNEAFQSLYASAANILGEERPDGMDGASVTHARADITVDSNGYVSSYRVAFTAHVTADVAGSSLSLSYDTDIIVRYHNAGQPVTLTPPAGYQDFSQVAD